MASSKYSSIVTTPGWRWYGGGPPGRCGHRQRRAVEAMAAVVAMAATMVGLGFEVLDIPAEWRDTAGLLLDEPAWG